MRHGCQAEIADTLSDEVIGAWSEEYRLSNSMNPACDPATAVGQQVDVFKAYAGAVDVHLGHDHLVAWIYGLMGLGVAIPDEVQPAPGPERVASSENFVGLLNERVHKYPKGSVELVYEASSSGAKHEVMWMMEVFGTAAVHGCPHLTSCGPANGVLQGTGHGRSKASAKEQAAREAYNRPQWKV